MNVHKDKWNVLQVCQTHNLSRVWLYSLYTGWFSRSPLIHVVGRSFCLYADSLFAQTGDSNDKMLFLAGCWILKRRRNATLHSSWRLSFNELARAKKNLVLHSSHFALNWRCCTFVLGERSSGDIWKFRTSSFKCYVDHSHTVYSSGNIDIRNWVQLFESRGIF